MTGQFKHEVCNSNGERKSHMVLLIDNYDSFTYNLYQYIGEMYKDIRVARNDEITLDEIEKLAPAAIVISPGPGYPEKAGVSVEVVKRFGSRIPILGVCLGHQAVAAAYGGKIVHAALPMHGKTDGIIAQGSCPLFRGLPATFTAARYHSLVVEPSSLPECLSVTARAGSGEIMGLAHKQYPVFGLQFHPESVLTKYGRRILRNFLGDVAGLTLRPGAQEPIPQAERSQLKPFLKKVIEGNDLNEEEAREAMDCIMGDAATNAQIGAFLTALRMKGETADEVSGFARSMRGKAPNVTHNRAAIDIVGTGGDMANTFNISTTSSFVVAGAGFPVAKHGNRSVSSRSGAADVLEALGVNIALTPAQASECLDEIGIAFMFAQVFHKSMKYAAAPRKEMGVRSVFNILGPLSNPARAEYMLLGVYDETLLSLVANVLGKLGVKGALVVHGCDGLDEVTVCDQTQVCELRDGKIREYTIRPENLGLARAPKGALTGGTAEENARLTLDVLQGKAGAQRDAVVMNAAAALYAAGAARGLAEGAALAQKSIDSGAAFAKLRALIEKTNKYKMEHTA